MGRARWRWSAPSSQADRRLGGTTPGVEGECGDDDQGVQERAEVRGDGEVIDRVIRALGSRGHIAHPAHAGLVRVGAGQGVEAAKLHNMPNARFEPCFVLCT